MPSGIYDRHKNRLPPHTRSGLKGVDYIRIGAHGNPLRKPWRAYLRHHGVFLCLGYFRTKEEAGKAYNAGALKIYGPQTYLNPV